MTIAPSWASTIRSSSVETGQVEVVGGLVEEQQVEARQEERRKAEARRLAAREGVERHVEAVGRQADLGESGAGARAEIRAAEREERLEGVGVLAGQRDVARQGLGELVEAPLGRGHPGASGEVLGHRLAAGRLPALVEQADPQGRRRAAHRPGVGLQVAGHHPQQGGLADPVRAHHSDAGVVGNEQRDAAEGHPRPEGDRDLVEGQHGHTVADRAPGRASRPPRPAFI